MIELLLRRRSVIANNLGEPGPTPHDLRQILTAAARVPDHKKLVPWRFILFEGEARERFGGILREACLAEEDSEATEGRLETERRRFLRAPVVVAVISAPRETPGVPEWEQILSAGAVCQNMIVATAALGYASQWITEWYGYSARVREALVLTTNERVAGFVYIGAAQEPPEERERPNLGDIVSWWRG